MKEKTNTSSEGKKKCSFLSREVCLFGSKNTVKILLFTILFLLIIALAYYLFFQVKLFEENYEDAIDNSEVVTDEEEDVDEGIPMTMFQGEYISTNLPQGWSIEEYVDGDGTDMLTSVSEYTGLTGVKIFKDSTEIFYMKAISGLGFAGCPFYAKFADESIIYYNQILEDNEVSGETVTVTDYTDTEYEEFTWLNVPFRRIGKQYVYDTMTGNDYFEPSCVPTLVAFYDLTLYSFDDGYGSSAYDYGATDEATYDDLLVVDQILKDMVLSEYMVF